MANNEGLLVYNGTKWQLYPVPNKTIVRSIGFGTGGRLYAGAQDELGYFEPDKSGRLQFRSLKNLLPDSDRNFTDIWELAVAGPDVFFRADNKIFRYSGGKLTVSTAPSKWLSLHNHLGRALAQDEKSGLLVFENGRWQPLLQNDLLPAGFYITGLAPLSKDTSLLCTMSHGLFLLTQNNLEPFRVSAPGFNPQQHFTSLAVADDTSFLAGSYFNGVYHISKGGKLLQNISAKNGLPNNTVRCLLTDRSGNAWMGLDNGLAFFACNNAIRHINPPAFNNGAGYGVQVLKGYIYFALSTGLQWLPMNADADISDIRREPVTIREGLTWNVSAIGDQLLAGRDDGFWMIRNQQAFPVSGTTGYWGFRPLAGTGTVQVAAGNYKGIHLFEMANGAFTDKGTLQQFSESSRYVEVSDNMIWVSHPYRGVFKINPQDGSVKLYTQKDGLPADLDNHVFKIKNKILFATTRGVYTYIREEDKMIPAPEYAELFGEKPIRYLKEDSNGNTWFVQEKTAGVADYSSGTPVIHYIPELNNKILSGFENIYPYNPGNVLVGSETGFYHINYEKYKRQLRPFGVYMTMIRLTGREDSVLFGGYATEQNGPAKISLPFKRNSLHFAAATTLIGQAEETEFSYYLKGFDNDWTKWEKNPEKEYTNLPAGNYTLQVKARTSPSHESSVCTYSFTIRSPWYKTLWAYGLYLLLLTGFIAALLGYQAKKYREKQEARRQDDLRRFEEEQKQTAYQHQLEMEKSEKELIRLQNEKLAAEIEYKNTELAGATMNLVHKKEFILKLKAELQQLQKNTKVGDDNPELKKLLKVLAEEEKLDKEWEQFAQHFNSVHGDFLTLLKNKFPALKPHELRLCAYLRLNLSSKEIAPLMSISVRGVEISRYRLRKKLNLSTEANLVEFLMGLA